MRQWRVTGTTTLRFDGGDPVDVSDLYGAIEEVPHDRRRMQAVLLPERWTT
jgi:hypothetical protein